MRILDDPIFGVCLVRIDRMQLGQPAISLEWLITIILEWLTSISWDFHRGDSETHAGPRFPASELSGGGTLGWERRQEGRPAPSGRAGRRASELCSRSARGGGACTGGRAQ
jgi:hypothetical protein